MDETPFLDWKFISVGSDFSFRSKEFIFCFVTTCPVSLELRRQIFCCSPQLHFAKSSVGIKVRNVAKSQKDIYFKTVIEILQKKIFWIVSSTGDPSKSESWETSSTSTHSWRSRSTTRWVDTFQKTFSIKIVLRRFYKDDLGEKMLNKWSVAFRRFKTMIAL